MIGRSVARYRISAKLGEGGMASVWKADDSLLGRPIALKLLSADLASSEDARRRFLREARAASGLNHPGICGVYDAGEADGHVYIALAWVDGRTVSALAERSPLAIADVLRIGIAAADALGFAHAHGVVHRDVTGRNIMVARDGRVVVLDFGLATAVGFSRLTTSGARMGTVAYMSPEVVRGDGADARTDLYGLGVVLYEALTGSLPFENERADAILYSIVHEAVEPPSRRRRDTPADLEQIVMRLLDKDPAGRYPNAQSLQDDLQALAPRHPPVTQRHGWMDEPAEPGSASRRRYLAVLPFEPFGPADAEPLQLFARGLAEVLGTALARQPALRVIPPSIAAREELTPDLQQAARQLGANLILSGKVRESRTQLRVTWTLLDPARGIQVGGDTIEAGLSDTFGLEDRLVASVLAALGLETSEVAATVRLPRDPAAHEHYVQAIGYLQRHEDEASIDAAVAILERLRVTEEPSASTEAALARAWIHKYRLSFDPRWENLAAQACERALAINDADPDVLVTLGELCNLSGQTERAIQSFERVLALDPEHPEALIGLGHALIAAGRLDDAEHIHRRAVELRPGFWGAHNALGRFLLRAGRNDEAAAEFRRVVELTPDNALGWRNLSVPLFALERFGDALEACRRSIEIRPTSRSLATLGSILFYLGRYEESAVAFERGIALRPEDPFMWGNLGSSCRFIPGYESRMQESLERAIALVRQRLDHNPQEARDWAWMACWQANLGRHGEARESIEKALALEPANPEFMVWACGVYHQAGERDSALHWLRQALAHGSGPAPFERDPHLAGLRDDPEYQSIIKDAPRRQGRPDPVSS